MRIGVMLREIYNQQDAPGIIILNLLDHLLEIDRRNEYVLFYYDEAFIERYRDRPNVRTVLVRFPTKLLWDQVGIPLAARREKIDLLFHPKHSIPLLARCSSLMHLRGSEYWVFPEHFERLDLLYQKLSLPLFCRKASHLIAESNYVRDDFHRILGVPLEKMSMIYLAPSERFRVIEDDRLLASIGERYGLPGDFFLTVTRVVQGKRYYPGKSLVAMIRAFARSAAREKTTFVVVGRQTRRFIDELPFLTPEVRRRILPLDFVPQEDLPALYNLARFFLFPSKYESFGIPITEAMACGCPVITSTDFSCPEIAGDAAILVDPLDPDAIARAIDRVHTDAVLREEMREKGFRRVETFNWKRAAEETLKLIEARFGAPSAG
jgi:glycosyltransferase involved in cell wall biosynthesis